MQQRLKTRVLRRPIQATTTALKAGEKMKMVSMRSVLFVLFLMLLAVAPASSAPVIQQTTNAFGWRPLPSIHSGIARGGLMAIVGDRLGPDSEISADGDPELGLSGVSRR